MSATYTVEYRGLTLWAANSQGSKYPILRTDICGGLSGSLMNIHVGVPNAVTDVPRIFRIQWTYSERLKGTYYCTLKAATNSTMKKRSHCPFEVYHWMGEHAKVHGGVYSSERGYRVNQYTQQGWPMRAVKSAGQELATVDFELRKVGSTGMMLGDILARRPVYTPQGLKDLNVGLEMPVVMFHLVFESVAESSVYRVLSKKPGEASSPSVLPLKRKRRGAKDVVHLGTIDLTGSDDDDVADKTGTPQKRQIGPISLPSDSPSIQRSSRSHAHASTSRNGETSEQRSSNSAAPLPVDLGLNEHPKTPGPNLTIVAAWKRLGVLSEQKGELRDRVMGLIKKDEGRVQAMKDFISKYDD